LFRVDSGPLLLSGIDVTATVPRPPSSCDLLAFVFPVDRTGARLPAVGTSDEGAESSGPVAFAAIPSTSKPVKSGNSGRASWAPAVSKSVEFCRRSSSGRSWRAAWREGPPSAPARRVSGYWRPSGPG
jgi:hypothetical protein